MTFIKNVQTKSRNLTNILNSTLSKIPSKQIFASKENGLWKQTSAGQLMAMSNACYEILGNSQLGIGDRIVYKGKNSVEWVAWNIATHAWGCAWVPLYSNQSNEHLKFIVKDCTPKLIITDDTQSIPNTGQVVMNNKIQVEKYHYNRQIPVEICSKTANIIYTSGTTGNPKGVILTHENIISNIESINKRFSCFQNENLNTLNILPWAHIYGYTAELYYNLLSKNHISISTDREKFIKELREVKPSILYLVPRVLQLIKNKLSIFDNSFSSFIVPSLLKYIFGGNIITIFVGGASVDKDTKLFFNKNGINICEGYGCTETSPMISVNHMTTPRDESSIGKIMDNLNVIIHNKEILVSGPSIMKGYWNNKEATQQVLVNKYGKTYYKTGDSGELKNGFLYYKGRISDNYKLNNGKFVDLKTIENVVDNHVSDKYTIYGENKEYNIIITEHPFTVKQETIKNINKKLDSHVHIKGNMLVPQGTFEQFYTPKMSLRRKAFFNHINDLLEIYYKNNYQT